MKHLLFYVGVGGLLFMTLGLAAAEVNPNKTMHVSLTGYGPVEIGMTREEIEGALGLKLKDDLDVHSPGCYYLTHDSPTGSVEFMVVKGKVSRIDIYGGDTSTMEGVKVGDSGKKVRQLYKGRLTIEPHHDGENDHYLIVESPQIENRILFEEVGGSVYSFRVGRDPELHYKEGCE